LHRATRALRDGYADVGDVTLHYVEAVNHPEVVDQLVILDAAHPRSLSGTGAGQALSVLPALPA
jgi:hypothetical protein